MQIEDIYKIIDQIIRKQKEARRQNDYLALMVNAEALLEYIPNLIRFSVDQEGEYRKFEAKLSNEFDTAGKKYTSSYCETQAKATDHYKNWQQSKQFIELMYEMVQMAKKLAGSVDKEFNAN